ncbi:hypothetical protein ABZV77_17960 [Streptomyces sp. NPDC004732]|uniref:hypothetical protein n=1 Tax=Streptomyces sp. NPDC004732 TaxID=3154290 RepID=UPI0033B71EF0
MPPWPSWPSWPSPKLLAGELLPPAQQRQLRSATRTLASADGRRVMTMNRNGDRGEQRLEDEAVETEFCDR